MDKLEEIFHMQGALNSRIGVNLPPATDEEKAKWILNYTRALQQETAELIDSVPWKWWAKYQKFDEQNAKVEVVDLFHFLVSLAQTLGMSADDVYQAYLKKNAVNHQRQDSGYVKKDDADSKHIRTGQQSRTAIVPFYWFCRVGRLAPIVLRPMDRTNSHRSPEVFSHFVGCLLADA